MSRKKEKQKHPLAWLKTASNHKGVMDKAEIEQNIILSTFN